MILPQDDYILLSFLNTKLRDEYPSFEALCEDLEISAEEAQSRMRKIGRVYDGVRNRFI